MLSQSLRVNGVLFLVTFAMTLGGTVSVGIFAQQAKKLDTKVTIKKEKGVVVVKVGNELFTQYVFEGYKKPFLYPLMINDETSLTRHWPVKTVGGEQTDHPHHKSVWFSHQVNGIMFWAEEGTVKFEKFIEFNDEDEMPSFVAQSNWVHDDQTVMKDQTRITFSAGETWRAIDFEVKLMATVGDVKLNDTKEGTFAIRVHPALRAKAHKPSGIEGRGVMTNSNGESGAKIWGRKAAWVDYSGEIKGKTFGVAIFDHPENLRHPTTWHARDYGLLAANPFGLHYFEKKEKGAGEYTIKKGDSLTLKYRLFIHEGDAKAAKVSIAFDDFAGDTGEKSDEQSNSQGQRRAGK